MWFWPFGKREKTPQPPPIPQEQPVTSTTDGDDYNPLAEIAEELGGIERGDDGNQPDATFAAALIREIDRRAAEPGVDETDYDDFEDMKERIAAHMQS